ncbi:MAG: hypothetical protein J7L07_02755 [Candidatus Odinarchaeota archaeon]|nr:hypothetical protein [Candidatus Odinarchaeota archaeon]
MKKYRFLLVVILCATVLASTTLYSAINVSEEQIPKFRLVDYQVEYIDSGIIKVTFKIENYGFKATEDNLTITWEQTSYELKLNDGYGFLKESNVGIDLNGDGDRVDIWEVEWVEDTLDVKVNGSYVHALLEPQEPSDAESHCIVSYYVNNESKMFKLGSKEHFLYHAGPDHASFGLNAYAIKHPSPNIELVIGQRFTPFRMLPTILAFGFKINGQSVTPQFQTSAFIFDSEGWMFALAYVIPIGAIDGGETIEFSFTIAGKTGEAYSLAGLLVNWSPGENIRHEWILFSAEFTL